MQKICIIVQSDYEISKSEIHALEKTKRRRS